MTTDTAVLERALMVMAVCMALQTLLFMAAAVAGAVAWRRTTEALRSARAEAGELRVYLDRMSARIDETSRALIRGTAAVDDVVTDVREAMGTVRSSVGNVASMVAGPKTALAVGLMKGLQVWRKRRAAQRLAAASIPEV